MYTNHLVELRTIHVRAISLLWNSTIEYTPPDPNDPQKKGGGTVTLPKPTPHGAKTQYDLDEQGSFLAYEYNPEKSNESSGLFYDQYQYICPWDMEIKLNVAPENRPMWHPNTTGGWDKGFNNIEIYIPKPPKDLGDSTLAEALAAWYSQNPSFLRDAPPPTPEFTADASPAVRLGDSSNHFLEFGGVVFRAVSLAWHESTLPSNKQNFINEFIRAESGIEHHEGETVAKAIQALENYFAYKYPWDIDLVVKWDDDARFDSGVWTNQKSAVLELSIPASPEEVTIEPIALTSYNSGGPTYPFT